MIRWTSLARALAAALLPVHSAIIASEAPVLTAPPPAPAQKEACPIPGCSYRVWLAASDIPLFEMPSVAATPVGIVPKGTTVQALTGEVQTIPGVYVFDKPTRDFRPGDRVWVYSYLGAGKNLVWHRGQWQKTMGIGFPRNNAGELVPRAGHWDRKAESVWWAQIQVSGTLRGWTNRPTDFDCRSYLGGNEEVCERLRRPGAAAPPKKSAR